MIAAYLPMAVLSVYTLTSSKNHKSSFIQTIPLAISFLILTVQVYFFMFSAWGGYSAAKSIKEGFENITGTSANFSLVAEIPVNSIQKSDVEGLIWIRENTPKDALIAVDRASFSTGYSNSSDYFYYAIFAERQMVIEGTSMVYVLKGASDKIINQRQQLIKILFNNSDETYEKIKDEGVDYVVQTKWMTPKFEPNKTLILVHSTDSLNIYKVE